MPQSLLTGQLKEKPTLRGWCLYSSFVHALIYSWLTIAAMLQFLFTGAEKKCPGLTQINEGGQPDKVSTEETDSDQQ